MQQFEVVLLKSETITKYLRVRINIPEDTIREHRKGSIEELTAEERNNLVAYIIYPPLVRNGTADTSLWVNRIPDSIWYPIDHHTQLDAIPVYDQPDILRDTPTLDLTAWEIFHEEK